MGALAEPSIPLTATDDAVAGRRLQPDGPIGGAKEWRSAPSRHSHPLRRRAIPITISTREEPATHSVARHCRPGSSAPKWWSASGVLVDDVRIGDGRGNFAADHFAVACAFEFEAPAHGQHALKMADWAEISVLSCTPSACNTIYFATQGGASLALGYIPPGLRPGTKKRACEEGVGSRFAEVAGVAGAFRALELIAESAPDPFFPTFRKKIGAGFGPFSP